MTKLQINRRAWAGVWLVALLLLAACGAPGEAPVTTPPPAPTESPTLVTIDLPPTAAPLTEAQAAATAEAGSPTLEPIPPDSAAAQTQVLTVAVNAQFEPFLFKDATGNLAGIDVDLLQALGSVADLEMAFVDTDFADLLAGVAEGRYDAGMAAITITPARAETMLFTDPYFSTDQMPFAFLGAGQGLAVPVSSEITGIADLTPESRIGVKSATTGAEYAAENVAGEIVEYPEAAVMFAALIAGEVDALILDNPVIADYITSNPDTIRLAGAALVQEQYGIAVKPGNEALVATLNNALGTIRENGVYQAILDKWLSP